MSDITESVIDQLLVKFPDFSPRWLESRGIGEERLPYLEIAEFARFVLDIFESGDEVCIRRVFDEVDRIFASGDKEVQTLITIGFLEDFQNIALQRKHMLDTFNRFLSPSLLEEWKAVLKFWSGGKQLIP